MSETVKKNWLTDKDGIKIAPKTVIDQVIDLDGTTLKTILDQKADTLSPQTAYSAKGSATKVPQITTNSLGQVTGITEVTITQPDISGKENSSNKVTSWSSTTTDAHYPSEKLVKTALDGKMASTVTHLSGDIATSEKGANNGVATLGSDGKVPSSQLPSYVDDVLEYSAKTSFPTTGESGKIYVETSTNKTYRWSGSAYVEISPSIALGETSSTAYAGDKGKANATAIAALQSTVASLPTSYPANGGNSDTVDNKHASDFATAAQGTKADNAVPNTTAGIGAAINLTESGTSTPSDDDWYMSQWAGGSGLSPINNTPVRRKHSALWNYIKSKIDAAGYKTTDNDTKNTAGSTDTSSKIFLIGATSQAANPQTYSDNEVYVTNGVLTTKSVQVGGTKATMQYNTTNECIDFIFS